MLNVLEKLLCHFPPFSIVKKNCIWRKLYLKTQNLKNSEKMIKAASLLHIIFQRFFCCPLAQPSGWGVYLLTPPMYELLPFATIFSTIQPYDKKNSQKVEKTEAIYIWTHISCCILRRCLASGIPVPALNTFWCLHFSLHYESISFPHFLASSFCIFIILMQIFPPTTNTSPSISSHPSLPHPDSELLTPQTSLNWSL